MPGPPPFEHIGIVGLGQIGGSVALAARRAWPGLTITALDPSPITDEAVAQGAITARASDIAQLIPCDVIVLAAPLLEIPALIAALGRSGTQALVTDTGNTKRVIMDVARQAPLSFVGGHPLAGQDQRMDQPGLAVARADLFDDKPWVLVSARNADALSTVAVGDAHAAREAMLTTFVVGLGAKPSWTDAVTHDRVMAHVSHAPQIVSAALRGASGDAGSMTGLVDTNADFIADAVTAIAAKLPTSAQALMDAPLVRAVFERARALKQPASPQ